MPKNYIEETKIDLHTLNMRIPIERPHSDRHRRTKSCNDRQLTLYGGSLRRRHLESPERKTRKVLPRKDSESRFAREGHLM